ncbi:hypothetical protein LIA77_04631 [Sarocladium implicatum]|nr:hypothetical protein LIA77_04631 [Sarocladium implicatum]
MSDDNQTSGAKPGPSSSSATSAAPTGHSLRRAFTIDDRDSSLRRRPGLGHKFDDAANSSSDNAAGASARGPARRSSNFSDYSLSEARGILNPAADDGSSGSTNDSSSLASLSLAFALLPAIAGSLFQNGSAVVTDIMLLGLAGVFLHWSVTQPWKWYHSAQQVRAQHESNVESVIEEDSDDEASVPVQQPRGPLEHVPEESESDPQSQETDQMKPQPRGPSLQQQAALRELYRYEIMSLLSCLVLPLVSAYLLHAIRNQLSRPSEGLVSNYNLTIFLLVSELRVFSHMIKLFHSRTLHLQRVVHANPYGQSLGSSSSGPQMEDLLSRLQSLENRTTADEALLHKTAENDVSKSKQGADIARDVRNTIQPELDALNRAVRRYEKKATLLQLQTESRFAAVDARVEDAIALAAAAAKNSASRKNIIMSALESTIALTQDGDATRSIFQEPQQQTEWAGTV